MSTRHLSGYYSDGYTLSARYSKLVIDKTADVRSDLGDGVTISFSATVVNQGEIYGGNAGLYLKGGGSLINGSVNNTGAAIIGRYGGVDARAPTTIANFGAIDANSVYDAGVYLGAGGSVTNGAASDTTAYLFGLDGVDALAVATVTNFGTIAALGYSQGSEAVFLKAGGAITNGSASDTSALIHAAGYQNGIVAGAGVTIKNLGTIEAGLYDVAAVVMSGGLLTNGSTHDTTAFIYGAYGITVSGAATTITNFGTIEGGGYNISVALSGAGDEVIAEAGSTFIGTIEGGGGSLALAGGGTGTIVGLGDGGALFGAVQARFMHFDTYVIEAGGSWTLDVSNEVNPAAELIDQGTLINTAFLTIAGTLSVAADAVFSLANGDISAGPKGGGRIEDDGLTIKNLGAGETSIAAHMYDGGVVEVATGSLDFASRLYGTGVLKIDADATLEADAGSVSTLTVAFDGAAATLALTDPKAFGATLRGFAAGDVIDLLNLTATGAKINGGDQLVVVDRGKTVATLQLSGNYGGATFVTSSDGHGGTDVLVRNVSGPAATIQAFVEAMAGFGARSGQSLHTLMAAPARQCLLTSPRQAIA
jgi:hypothetical protein